MKNDVRIHLCVLAAGASRRFGAAKQLYPINGQPMVMHVYNECNHASIVKKSLVLGAHFEHVSAVIPGNVNVVFSKNWDLGLSASIHSAIDAMSEDATHLMLALADQVSILSTEYEHLVNACLDSPNSINTAVYAKKRGVPAIFPRETLPALTELKGDRGASSVLNSMHNVFEINLPSALIDIDTRDDLQHWKARI